MSKISSETVGLFPTRPIWFGEPCERVCFDMATGGLGDAVRTWRIAQAALKQDRIREVHYRCWPNRLALIDDTPWFPWDAPLPDMPFFPAIHVFARHCITPYPRTSLLHTVGAALNIPYSEILATSYVVATSLEAQFKDSLVAAGWRGERCVAVQLDDIPQSAVHSPWNDFKRAKCAPDALMALANQIVQDDDFVYAIGYGTSDINIPDMRNGDLPSLMGFISVADQLICADSGPQHLAAILGTPATVLFGPSDPKIHLADPSFLPIQHLSCPHQPCGLGSLYGMPLGPEGPMLKGHGRLEAQPLPCPNGNIGQCLHDKKLH